MDTRPDQDLDRLLEELNHAENLVDRFAELTRTAVEGLWDDHDFVAAAMALMDEAGQDL